MKVSRDKLGESWIELPDLDDVVAPMFEYIIKIQKKHALKASASAWEVSIRDARLCALYASKFGKWGLSGYTVEEFINYLDSDPQKVQMVAWVSNVFSRYIRELLDPNAYAVN